MTRVQPLLDAPSPGPETAFSIPHLDDSFPGTSNDRHSSAMKLRDHPLMSYRGVPNWPPVWTQMRIGGVKIVKGEVGVLIYVHAGGASNTCYLLIEHENENYIGNLVFDDPPFCHQIIDLLQQHPGGLVKEIGELDVSFTPE
jgi:hypothetical protein